MGMDAVSWRWYLKFGHLRKPVGPKRWNWLQLQWRICCVAANSPRFRTISNYVHVQRTSEFRWLMLAAYRRMMWWHHRSQLPLCWGASHPARWSPVVGFLQRNPERLKTFFQESVMRMFPSISSGFPMVFLYFMFSAAKETGLALRPKDQRMGRWCADKSMERCLHGSNRGARLEAKGPGILGLPLVVAINIPNLG